MGSSFEAKLHIWNPTPNLELAYDTPNDTSNLVQIGPPHLRNCHYDIAPVKIWLVQLCLISQYTQQLHARSISEVRSSA